MRIVRTSLGESKRGNECYFPTEEVREDPMLPRVAEGTYTSGKGKTEQDRAKKFLIAIGVREVGEQEQVEAILKQRYTRETGDPSNRIYEKDLRRFISLVQETPKTATLFSEYRSFEREDGKWALPCQVYLDSPYLETGLHAFFRPLNNNESDTHPVALADRYRSIGVSREELVDFAKAVGAHSELKLAKQSTDEHPNQAHLRRDWYRSGTRCTNTSIDTDWTIRDLKSVLEKPTEELSRLIWNTMKQADATVLHAKFRPNRQHETRTESSTLVLMLRELAWLPQQGGVFVRPAVASRDLLPEGFPFDPGWPWIKALCFGEESDRRVEELEETRTMAKKLGFNDDEVT